MRKTFLLLALMGLLRISYGQPSLSMTDAPIKVNVYDKYEVSFTLGYYSNPYDPEVIDVFANFTSPDGRVFRVIGFYYEDYSFKEEEQVEVATRQRDRDCWKVRFTPDLPGEWTYEIHAVDRKGKTYSTGSFYCQPKANANGFIRLANSQFLKREVVANSQRGEHSFFPVGLNVAWYGSADYNYYKKPYGVYEYRRYIDALAGNANYLRIWSCRYQYLSLYGPEHAIRENDRPIVFFDSTLNQKDAAELDDIVDYAADHDINLMLCLFAFGDLRDDSEGVANSERYGSMPSGWRYNPYHTILGLERPVDFFSDPKAMRVTRNLLRYFVARWGYATNIVCWELFNEVAYVFKNTELQGNEQDAIVNWHNEMCALIQSIDPHQHLVSTSVGSIPMMEDLKYNLYDSLDIVQDHIYKNIQNAKPKERMTQMMLDRTTKLRKQQPQKPCFIGEYGLKNDALAISNSTRDPKGVDLHNTLWSTLFSGSMGPASFWYWKELRECELYDRFRPMMVFSNQLPVLSNTFTAATTGEVKGRGYDFPNNIETNYLVNATEDTLIGWCQDAAFGYKQLRQLTDSVGKDSNFVNDGVFDPEGYVYTLDPMKRPRPSSLSNRIVIPIQNQRPGTVYMVRWFDAETGRELRDEMAETIVRRAWFRGKRIVIDFPSSIRNIIGSRVNNNFGDAVFVITKE